MYPTAHAHGKDTQARAKIRDLNTHIVVKIRNIFCTPFNALVCCIVKLVELHDKYYVINPLTLNLLAPTTVGARINP